MRAFDSNILGALAKSSVVLRYFVFIQGKTSGGNPVSFGFWNGEDDITVSVISGSDRTSQSRDYIAGGALLNTPQIPTKIGLEVRNITIELSQIHASVQNMVRGNNIKNANVELHRGVFDIDTGQLVSSPLPIFYGNINASTIKTPSDGGNGSVTLSCVSKTRGFTRINTAKKSDESQKLRNGDRSRRYLDGVGEWQIFHGESGGS